MSILVKFQGNNAHRINMMQSSFPIQLKRPHQAIAIPIAEQFPSESCTITKASNVYTIKKALRDIRNSRNCEEF